MEVGPRSAGGRAAYATVLYGKRGEVNIVMYCTYSGPRRRREVLLSVAMRACYVMAQDASAGSVPGIYKRFSMPNAICATPSLSTAGWDLRRELRLCFLDSGEDK